MKKLLLAAAATALLGSLPAHAATVSHSDSFSGTTNWATVLQLPKFDSALGVLQQVQLQLRGESMTSFSFENWSAAPRTATQSSTVTLAFGAPGSAQLTIPLSVVVDVAAEDGVDDFDGPGGYTRVLSGSQQQTLQWLAGVNDLGAFLGAGLFGVSVAADALSVSTSGSRDALIHTTAGASVRVSYTYASPASAVPEPGSLALAAAALAAAGLLRRRRA